MSKKLDTPMLDKMFAMKEESQLCGEFLEFLQKKYDMFDRSVSREQPFYIGAGDYINTENVLAEFLGIDLAQANKEKDSILNSLN
ncbi:MAG: hypothetical protein UFG06_13960 [Lachnospiraceae bacterium]|nr:hypothetical protein [Lachnospiraceae bacterium]